MSALTIERRRGKRTYFCESGCRTSQKMRRTASHKAMLLDRPIYLCAECAKLWRRTWDELLGVEEAVAA